MDELSFREINIKKLIDALLGPETAHTSRDFEELCLCFSDEDINYIHKEFMKKPYMKSIYWLTRYLVEVERPMGFSILFSMAQSEDDFLRERASSAIAEIDKDAKAEMLTKMLDFKWEREVLFAIDRLGKDMAHKAVVPLVSLIEKYRDNEKICFAVIKALGRIGDNASLFYLERVIEKSGEKYKKAAAEAMARLIRVFHIPHLKRYISSSNSYIRGVAYDIAVKLTGGKGDRYLVAGLNKEEEAIKIKILSGITCVKTYGLFYSIFNIALKGKSLGIRKAAISCIKRSNSMDVLRHALKVEGKLDPESKIAAIEILSEYSGSARAAGIIVKNYKKSRHNLVRVSAIEALGKLKIRKYAPFLLKIIREGNEFSWAAAISLISILDTRDWLIIHDILSCKDKNTEWAKQVFLQLILRLEWACKIPAFIRKDIDELLLSENRHVKYLAIRCVPKNKKMETLEGILISLNADQYPYIKEAFTKSLEEILIKYPDELTKLLDKFAEYGEIEPFYYPVFKNFDRTKRNYEKVIKTILTIISRNTQILNMGTRDQALASGEVGLLEIQAAIDKSSFLEYMSLKTVSDIENWAMMKALNNTDAHLFAGIDIDFMAGQYKDGARETKLEYLKFFKRTAAKSRAVKSVIYEDLYKSDDEEVRESIELVLAEWIDKLGKEPAEVFL